MIFEFIWVHAGKTYTESIAEKQIKEFPIHESEQVT